MAQTRLASGVFGKRVTGTKFHGFGRMVRCMTQPNIDKNCGVAQKFSYVISIVRVYLFIFLILLFFVLV